VGSSDCKLSFWYCNPMAQARFRALSVLVVVLPLALAALTCLALPIYVIRPFRHQGATELSVALFVTRIAPAVSLACAIGAVAVLIFFWRRVQGWGVRTLAIFALLGAVASAWLTRINVYELMFHHLDRPEFTAADRAHVD